jgi:hypothetical protein
LCSILAHHLVDMLDGYVLRKERQALGKHLARLAHNKEQLWHF